jgi:hypothetical protein
MKADDVITHGQTIFGNSIIIISLHDFAHQSRWCYELQESKKYYFS